MTSLSAIKARSERLLKQITEEYKTDPPLVDGGSVRNLRCVLLCPVRDWLFLPRLEEEIDMNDGDQCEGQAAIAVDFEKGVLAMSAEERIHHRDDG